MSHSIVAHIEHISSKWCLCKYMENMRRRGVYSFPQNEQSKTINRRHPDSDKLPSSHFIMDTLMRIRNNIALCVLNKHDRKWVSKLNE